MKIRNIIIPILLVAVVVVFAACKKSRYCHCVSTTGDPDTVVVNIDRSMKCDNIMELTFRRKEEGQTTYTVQKVDCVELDVDTAVTSIPDRSEPED